MSWIITSQNPAAIPPAVRAFLERDPVGNNVTLAAIEALARHGPDAHGTPALTGWWVSDGGCSEIEAVFFCAGRLRVTALPVTAADELASLLVDHGHGPRNVGGDPEGVEEFTAAWKRRGLGGVSYRLPMKLHTIASEPATPWTVTGQARTACEVDVDSVHEMITAFGHEVAGDRPRAGGGDDSGTRIAIAEDLITVWEADGVTVAIAARTVPVCGVARIGPVYTLPSARRRGYASAVTVAAARAAFADGASTVALYTDNTGDNYGPERVYAALGFIHVGDHLTIGLTGVAR